MWPPAKIELTTYFQKVAKKGCAPGVVRKIPRTNVQTPCVFHEWIQNRTQNASQMPPKRPQTRYCAQGCAPYIYIYIYIHTKNNTVF